MSEWQPIETAPKDGTEVLGFSDMENIGAGYYFDFILFWKGKWRTSSFLEEVYVTHWMPLPEPPKESSDE